MRFDLHGRAMMATSALTIALTLLLAALTTAPAGAAGTPDPATGGTSAAAATPPTAHQGRVRTSVSVLTRRTQVRAGRSARIAGRVRPAVAGRLVLLQRVRGARWVTIARAHTRAGGRYVLRYRTRSSLSAPIRVRVTGAAGATRRTRRIGRLEAFRPALASWYGEGQALACGGHLTPGMMGVAHKSLPCGTKVTIRYRGRQVRVPVVDRGPYAGGREFDLGPGVRAALRFDGVGTIQVAH